MLKKSPDLCFEIKKNKYISGVNKMNGVNDELILAKV